MPAEQAVRTGSSPHIPPVVQGKSLKGDLFGIGPVRHKVHHRPQIRLYQVQAPLHSDPDPAQWIFQYRADLGVTEWQVVITAWAEVVEFRRYGIDLEEAFVAADPDGPVRSFGKIGQLDVHVRMPWKGQFDPL